MRRGKKVKWSKRMEEQNMKSEIYCNIKTSDLIGTNMKHKKLMLKTSAREKIIQIMKKRAVEFVSVESHIYHCLPFLDPPLVM